MGVVNSHPKLAVVGGGVIGLAVAARAAREGWRVTVHDPDPGRGASWVAGGMLTPLSEGWPGEDRLLDLGLASLALWPDFARALDEPVITAHGALTVALDPADVEDLRRIAHWLSERGQDIDLLDRAGVRAAEPAIGRTARFGLFTPRELSVDNRALVFALRSAAIDAGVSFDSEPVVRVDDLGADQVVVAAGASSRRLCPELPVRAVKGEILRLRSRAGSAPAPRLTIRARVHGRPVYLVPRGDGLVLGATQYDATDTQVTVAGVRDLIGDAEAVFPAIGDFELAEASAGLRPMTPDNMPLIGRVNDRVVAATGHGRGGILLTPVTVEGVMVALGVQSPDSTTAAPLQAADPQRFAGVRP